MIKLGIIGLGGIGSHFAANLSEVLKADVKGIREVNPMNITVFDGDTVEEKNLMYANYDVEDLGKRKVDSISRRFSYIAYPNSVDAKLIQEITENFSLAILCVDNNEVRRLFYESGMNFLDLRATGKFIACFQVIAKSPEYAEHLDGNDGISSCQFKHDLETRTIRFGNRVAAELGLSLLQDYALENNSSYREKIFSL